MKITRTFTKSTATINDPNAGQVTKEYVGIPANKVMTEIKKEYPENTGIMLSFTEVKREMDVETFIANSVEVQ